MSERTQLAQADAPRAGGIEVALGTWTGLMDALGHTTDYKRAKALEMDHAVLSRLRAKEERGEPTTVGTTFIARTLELGIPYDAVFRTGRAV